MDELKEACVCESPHPPCTHPCLEQSIWINISRNKNLLVRKKLRLFWKPKGSPCFCLFWYSHVWCHFLGDHLGKMETKHLVIIGWKDPASLYAVWGSWQSEQTQAKCAASPRRIEIYEQFGKAAHTYPPFAFMLRSPWHRLPSPPSRACSANRRSGWQLHITVPHCSAPHHFHYIVILSYQQRWTGKDEWHIPTSGAATTWLRHVLANDASCHASQESAGQVSGQGAALILHKYGRNPLIPHLAGNNTSVLKWKAMYLGRMCSLYHYMSLRRKVTLKKKKKKKRRSRYGRASTF